jgi:putative oxygen-independent coproporphyrinogen III oxidase
MGIYREVKAEDTIGIYVHIPFCASKCPYCDFKSRVTSDIPEKEYVESLLKELSSTIEREDVRRLPLESVYIGGGTPSLFSPASIGRLIESFNKEILPIDGCEVTIEVNPDSADLEKLTGYREAGVNRVSIGVQSLNDKDLLALGRAHSAGEALEAFDAARAAGFENIGVDLIFGVPGQNSRDWRDTISKVVDLGPEHISVYGLTIEEGTPFAKMYGRGRAASMPLPGEGEEAEMYSYAIELLVRGGWRHYEISNFGKPGFFSVHNRRYWLGKDYLGLGAAAHSYLSYPGWGRRWWNEPGVAKYLERIKGRGEAKAGCEALGRDEAMEESLLLGLRMLEKGLNGEAFMKRFGKYPKEVFKKYIKLEKDGFLRISGEDILLSPGGVLMADEILAIAAS